MPADAKSSFAFFLIFIGLIVTIILSGISLYMRNRKLSSFKEKNQRTSQISIAEKFKYLDEEIMEEA